MSGSHVSQWVAGDGRAQSVGGGSMKHLFSNPPWGDGGEVPPGSQVSGSVPEEAAREAVAP